MEGVLLGNLKGNKLQLTAKNYIVLVLCVWVIVCLCMICVCDCVYHNLLLLQNITQIEHKIHI
jgi:hypothetical protein